MTAVTRSATPTASTQCCGTSPRESGYVRSARRYVRRAEAAWGGGGGGGKGVSSVFINN